LHVVRESSVTALYVRAVIVGSTRGCACDHGTSYSQRSWRPTSPAPR
jgi:hypothetical protein